MKRATPSAILLAAMVLPPATLAAATVDLATAGRMAVESSADLRLLEDQAAAVGCALNLAVRDYFPRLSLGYLDSSSIATDGPDAASIQWTATVKQPLFDWGRSRRQRRLAKADLELQLRLVEDKKREIVESVDTAYHRVLMLRRKLASEKDTLSIANKELEIARAQRDLGSLRAIDLVESELQRDCLEISILSSEADLEESGFALRQLLGLHSESVLELVDDFDSGYEGLAVPEGSRFLKALVREGNLDLRTAPGRASEEIGGYRRVEGLVLPNISLEGSLSLSGKRYPLQSASVSGKLVFEIPAPTSPIGFSITEGASTGKQRASGSAIDFSPLQDLAPLSDGEAALRECAVLRQRIDEMGASLEFQVGKSVAGYRRDRASLGLQRRDLAMQRTKAEIQKKLLDLGEATWVDYFKTLVATAQGESTILESVLKLRQSERAMERFLGLAPGSLERVCAGLDRKED